jgi:hypothetical protein
VDKALEKIEALSTLRVEAAGTAGGSQPTTVGAAWSV